ncbi:MAG: cell division protein FtsA [Proteobacteria bacterium]|nr:cell division protein FtsA [Pseudomonadota bacterium]
MPKDKKSAQHQKQHGVAGQRALYAGERQNIISVLDIGSSKVCCFIAEVRSHGTIEVIGIGHQASRGVKSGTIVDLKAVETVVAHVVESAETMAKTQLHGQPIKSVFMNVSGAHTLSHQMTATVKVVGREVSDRDVRNALAHGRGVVVDGKDELVHVIPAGYTLDRTRGIQEPRGMVGETLGVSITAVTGLSSSLCHLTTIAGQNHLERDGFCSTPYASGLSSLVGDEIQLGCTVVDMGGGTTSIAVFVGGKLIYTAAIPVGGVNVTNDIARGLTTSLADAERIKTLYGSAHSLSTDDGELIDVPPIGEEEHSQPNYVPRSLLTGIIQPRIEETFELVRAKLVDSGINQIAGRRVVLTGGASQLQGLSDIAQLILDKQVRLGRPQGIRGLAEATGGPAFSAAAGLLIYAAEHASEIPVLSSGQTFGLSTPLSGHLLHKVTHWLRDNW